MNPTLTLKFSALCVAACIALSGAAPFACASVLPDEPRLLLTGGDLDSFFYGNDPALGGNFSTQEKLLRQARDQYLKGNILEAYKIYKRVVAMQGPYTDPFTEQAMALCGLADCYVKQGSFKEAEKMIQHAVSMIGIHANSWMPLTALAGFYADQGKLIEAEAECRKALALCEKTMTDVSRETAICRLNLGILLAQAKKFDEAQSYFEKATQSVGEHDVLFWKARANSAYLLAAQGKTKQAEADYTAVAQKLVATKNASRSVLAELLKNRAILMKRAGNPVLAEKLYKEIEEAQKEPAKEAQSAKPVNYRKFMLSMEKKIQRQWHPAKDWESKRIIARFTVAANGTISDVEVVESSSIDAADKAALAAIEKASPVDPLPEGADAPASIEFTFERFATPNYGHWGFSRY